MIPAPAPPVAIHRLGPGDVPLARRLNLMFAAAFGEEDIYVADPPPDAYLAQVLGKENVVPLAALDGDALVGGLVAYELDKLERARREVYVYDLAVAEAWRRRGIATALLERLRQIAAARGAWVIFIQADRGDAAAIALYEKLGRREEVLHFDIAVPQREP